MEKNNLFLSLKITNINKIPIVFIFITSIFIAIVVFNSGKKYIVYNHTNSIPKGFYSLNNDINKESITKNDLIVFNVPNDLKKMVIDRRWLSKDDTLTKPVSASEGDFVCTNNRTVIVNDISYGHIDKHDSYGREMPWFKYCSTVKSGEFFVFINNSKSFDSRYFGSINSHEIIAKAKPLWIF